MSTAYGPFPVTRWSMVLAVRDGGDVTQSRLALEELCRIYWRPIYAYARHQGLAPADAEDVTQSFFQFVLEKDLFSSADATLGRLRNYLLTAFGRHIKHWHRQANAQKRGGGREVLSLEASQAEDAMALEPPDHRTPEMYFERQCALRIIEEAVAQLAEEQRKAGREDQFTLLRPRLDPSTAGSGSDAEIAARLGMSHDAVRQTITRLRRRFREIMRDLVAGTLQNPTAQSLEEELVALRNALMG